MTDQGDVEQGREISDDAIGGASVKKGASSISYHRSFIYWVLRTLAR